jgi:membrane carboxypeptidase/penicillin-binding protein
MREALRNVPQRTRPMPQGLVQARVNPDTGALANADDPNGIFEIFMADHMPTGGILGSGDIPADEMVFGDGADNAAPGMPRTPGDKPNEPLF